MLLASPSFRAFELGGTAPEEFAQALIAELKLRVAPDDFLKEFENWPQGFFPGATELLAGQRPKYKLACLSNSNAVHWAKLGDLLTQFDVAMSSHCLHQI